jgi:hypothetical protein
MIELQSEIDNWKDKHNRTQDEVAKLKVKYSLDKFRPIWTSLDTTHTVFLYYISSGLIIFWTSF